MKKYIFLVEFSLAIISTVYLIFYSNERRTDILYGILTGLFLMKGWYSFDSFLDIKKQQTLPDDSKKKLWDTSA